MACDIVIMAVKAKESEIEKVIPDVFELVETDTDFEDVAACNMGPRIGVGHSNGWIIIIDSYCRFVHNDKYPRALANDGFKVKSFFVSEDLVFKNYSKTSQGKLVIEEYVGIEAGIKYLEDREIIPEDYDGEAIIMQIIESEIFNNRCSEVFSLMDLTYRKYDLDI